MTRERPNLEMEQSFWQQDQVVVGIDEVGRGPLAGPVVAAAVVLPADYIPHVNLNDSKQVNLKHRLELDLHIRSNAMSFGIGEGSVSEINSLGIVPATLMAMSRAIQALSTKPNHCLIDGVAFANKHADLIKPWPTQTYIVKGDQKSCSIAAASIIAKVYRDQLMAKLAEQFPDYGWETNVGYGTKQHRQAIQKHGATEHHRVQFIQNIT